MGRNSKNKLFDKNGKLRTQATKSMKVIASKAKRKIKKEKRKQKASSLSEKEYSKPNKKDLSLTQYDSSDIVIERSFTQK